MLMIMSLHMLISIEVAIGLWFTWCAGYIFEFQEYAYFMHNFALVI